MVITKEEAKKFDSQYFSMEVGESCQLVITGWKIEERAFGTKPPSPKLIMNVVSREGIPVNKEWETGNRKLIDQLLPMMFRAQENGKASIVIAAMQLKQNEFHIQRLSEV